MKISYLGKTYECVSAEKKPTEIIIHTGKYEDGEEIVYHIFGDIDFNAVTLEGGEFTIEDDKPEVQASADDILNALLGVSRYE